jgi:hypothetical protein
MTAQRFNPLTNATNLKQLGLDSAIADEIAQQQAAMLQNDLATKNDLAILRQDIQILKQDLIIKLSAVIVFCSGCIIAAINFILKFHS